MSTPRGPHNPIKPETFSKRVDLWHNLIKNSTFLTMSFEECMDKAQPGDVIYCDPPYLITTGSYNDGNRGFKNWGEMEEKKLYNFLDKMYRNLLPVPIFVNTDLICFL